MKDMWLRVIAPLLGGIILFALGIRSAVTFWSPDSSTTAPFGIGGQFVLGIGAIVIGIPLMIWWNLTRSGREYFSGRTMESNAQLLAEADADQSV